MVNRLSSYDCVKLRVCVCKGQGQDKGPVSFNGRPEPITLYTIVFSYRAK